MASLPITLLPQCPSVYQIGGLQIDLRLARDWSARTFSLHTAEQVLELVKLGEVGGAFAVRQCCHQLLLYDSLPRKDHPHEHAVTAVTLWTIAPTSSVPGYVRKISLAPSPNRSRRLVKLSEAQSFEIEDKCGRLLYVLFASCWSGVQSKSYLEATGRNVVGVSGRLGRPRIRIMHLDVNELDHDR